MIAIANHAEGCTLAVRAQPGARKTGVLGEHNGALKIAVTAPPEDGRANEAILEVLHDYLGLKRSQIELLQGRTQRNKVFLIRGVTANELSSRLAPPTES
jgi:uncharacterized protein (TIGR00251 family)